MAKFSLYLEATSDASVWVVGETGARHHNARTIELSDAELSDLRRAERDFEKWQGKLYDLYHSAKKP